MEGTILVNYLSFAASVRCKIIKINIYQICMVSKLNVLLPFHYSILLVGGPQTGKSLVLRRVLDAITTEFPEHVRAP